MASEVVVDQDGDIYLALRGRDEGATVKLRVSSKVLTLASPVFNVMLNGAFKEASDLAKKTAANPYVLELPDDDAEAVTILARVLHFKFQGVPERPSPACLEELAFICDKYACAEALKYCGSAWTKDWLGYAFGNGSGPSSPPIEDMCKVLVFTYVADLAQEFAIASWEIFLHHKGPIRGEKTQAGLLVEHPVLHHNVARMGMTFTTTKI